MRKLTLSIGLAVMLSGLAGMAQADIVTFRPTPRDLGDLDHNYYHTWSITGWSVPDGHYVVSAVLEIDNLNNWQIEPDILYIHLLDNPPSGVRTYYDHEGNGDAFAGQGVLLTTYTDDNEILWWNPPEDWSYSFTAAQLQALTAYAADKNFGLGLDADCHYYNDGVKLTVETAVVPEPASLLVIAAGLLLRRIR